MTKKILLVAALAAELSSAATQLNLDCSCKDAVCAVGDEVTFVLTATDASGALVRSGRFNASLDNFGSKAVVAKREYDLAAANPVVLRGKLDEPGFLRLNVVMPGVTNFLWSVAVSPEKIRPGAECPADFDAFWDKAIAKYDAEVKEDVVLTPVPQVATAELDAFKVTLSTIGGRKLYGMLTRPKDLSKGPFPLRFEGKGAGPASQGLCGKPGRVTLCMNVHYYDAPVPSSKKENDALQEGENREWYNRFKAKRAGYQVLGIAGEKEDYFYHAAILGTRRVFRWAAKQPYVDPTDVTYNSTSQGGGFGLYMAALCPQIRKLAVFVPALTDLCGYRARRMSGWPRLVEEQLDANREKAAANAGYYDAVNFAARVRCPTRVTVGFSDDTCPPSAVYSAYNALRVLDKEIWHGVGMTHLVRGDLYARGEKWLAVKEPMKTPETSRLFVRNADPKTDVVSYWLKPGLVDFHQQSLYFTAKSMTDDGRFLVFDATPDPFADAKVHRDTETRRKYVVDFLRDEVYPVGGASVDGQIPFLDTKADRLYYVGKDHMSVCVCDLADDPSRETVLCRFSDEILEGGAAIARMGTHLTLTPDRRQAFLDYSVFKDAKNRSGRLGDTNRRWFLGLADLQTGKMRKWAETDFCSNHASIHPTDPTLGLFAYEGCWDKPVVGPDGVRKMVRRGEDEVYPRLWLAHADGRTEMIPSRIWNFGTHENWTEDGKGFYWSSYHGGTAYHDLATGEQTRVCPFWCIHTDMSGDGRYVVTDQWADGDGFRGCAWRYAFWNRTTGRGIAIRSCSPAIATKERQSALHPDAHVQFVCGGKYIVATANGDDRRMNLAVTPVAPLAALTSSPETAPRTHRLPIAWTGAAAKDELCEVVADCADFVRRGLVTPPPVRCDVAWAPYGVYATVNGESRRLTVEPYLGEKPMETVVRFVVPVGATALDFVVNDPGRFEPKDRDTLARRPAARRLTLEDEKAPSAWNTDWPAGTDPTTVSRRLSELFLTTEADDYHPVGYSLSDGRPQKGYGWRQCIFYATVSLWINALECAHLSGNADLEKRLVAKFEPFLGPKLGHFPKFRHVDYTIAGAVPLEVAILTGDARAARLGLKYADMQWAEPKPDDPPPPMNKTPYEERLKLWKDGYSDQTRLWIDDAYMMTVLQSQAYRLTKDPKYIDRAAKEMCLYLDKLQLADGLFNHAPDAPHKWGRGNGWMAAGMPMVLKHLPVESPYRAKILAGYRKMMASLLSAQNPNGMWNQLVGDREAWQETSATAMFTYAFAMGARNGWLDAAVYGPAARKGYLALVDRLDRFGNVPDVCAGTCTKDERDHYLKRPRIHGDPHAQAPLLWICSALLEDPSESLLRDREVELKAAVPAIFAKAADRYRTLLKAVADQPKEKSPKRFQGGKVVMIGPTDWCSGFFAGSLWYLYEHSKDDFWKQAAVAYTDALVKPLWDYNGDHDIGFRVFCSAGNALRLTGEGKYADFLHQAAKRLGTRFDEKLGLIRSWDGPKNPDGFFQPKYIVIIDNMMNLELLEWDAKNGGTPRSDVIARSQADSTDRYHFRADGSAYHVVGYDPDHPGRIRGVYAGQGATTEGTWARGHAWAVHGFTTMYRETKNPKYFARAQKAADYWMNEPNLPSDAVPYWDFSAVGEERDASAASVTASGLVELAALTPDPKRAAALRAFAAKTLLSLASPAYFAAEGENGGFILKHSVGNKPFNSEVDVPLNYADYYFLEALLRFCHNCR